MLAKAKAKAYYYSGPVKVPLVPPALASRRRSRLVVLIVALIVFHLVVLLDMYLPRAVQGLHWPSPADPPGGTAAPAPSPAAALVLPALQPAQQLVASIARLVWKRMYEEPQGTGELQVELVKLLANFTQANCTRTDITFLTFATDNDLKKYGLSAIMNALYAKYHGYPFILEQDTSAPVPENNIFYYKVLAIRKHLRNCENLVYLDADALVMDSLDNDLFHRLFYNTSALEGADFMMADHSENLNAGVLLFRNTQWANKFVDAWWAKIEKHRVFMWWDQSALYLTILDELMAFRNQTGPLLCPARDECNKPQHLKSWLNICTNGQFNCRGFPYNHRLGIGKMSILPQNDNAFRINQWHFTTKMHEAWVPDDFYRKGDLLAHTKEHKSVITDEEFVQRLDDTLMSLRRRWAEAEAKAVAEAAAEARAKAETERELAEKMKPTLWRLLGFRA